MPWLTRKEQERLHDEAIRQYYADQRDCVTRHDVTLDDLVFPRVPTIAWTDADRRFLKIQRIQAD